MAREKKEYSKKLAGIFASSAVIAYGTLSLLSAFSIDIEAMVFFIKITVPTAFTLGVLGFLIGKNFDNPRKFKRFLRQNRMG